MKYAIFNGLPQHHEMFSYVLDYFKKIGENIDVYTNKTNHYGWLDFYILKYGSRNWYPISFFNPDAYNYVFLLTDDDTHYAALWNKKTKVIVVEHDGKRMLKLPAYKTLQTRKFNLRSPPSDPETWVLPIWNNTLYTKYDKLTVMSIGCAARFLNLNSLFSNYNDIQFILVDRYMNLGSTDTNTIKYRELDAPTMIEYASKSHYILFWPTTGYSTNHMHHSMSGSFPLAYSVGTPLLMPESYIEPLGIGKAGIGIFGMPDSSAIHLEKPTQSQYGAFIVEREGLLKRRDRIFNSIMKLYNTKIISLGGVGGCELATAIREFNQPSYPYDWLITTQSFVMNSFNNFDNFFAFNKEFVYNTSQLLNKNKTAIMLHDFHNFDLEHERTKIKYKRRYERLSNTLNGDNPILFVRIYDNLEEMLTPKNYYNNIFVREKEDLYKWNDFISNISKEFNKKIHLLLITSTDSICNISYENIIIRHSIKHKCSKELHNIIIETLDKLYI